MTKKVLITHFHPDNSTASAARTLIQTYQLTEFELVTSVEKADIILYLEYGYIGLSDLAGIIRRMKRAARAMHFIFCESDWPFPILPGAYPSLTRRYPWAHSWAFLPRPGGAAENVAEYRSPDLLFSFLGRAETHPIRRELLAFDGLDTPCLDVREAPARMRDFDYSRTYSDLIRRSKFGLCPRGFGASSIRIFEVMAQGRVPVIISDAWQAPPGIPWAECCVMVREHEVSEIPTMLRKLEGRAESMGRIAKDVYDEKFAAKHFLDRLLSSLVERYASCSFTTAALWKRAGSAMNLREVRSAMHRALSHSAISSRARQ